jgi:hypothetical protein
MPAPDLTSKTQSIVKGGKKMLLKKKPRPNRLLRLWAAGAFVVMVVINILANILPINSVTTVEVSDSYPNLFAPAGFTFAIWGVIYVALGLYSLYQLGFLKQKKTGLDDGEVNTISKYFLISSILNSVWIVAWHYKVIWLTVLLIVGILACLIRIAQITRKQTLSKREEWLVRAPFGVYFGWITVATITNITTWLVSINWDGWGRTDEFWTVTILTVGAIIGLIRMRYDQDALYGLVFIWVYSGILAKHVSESGWDGQYLGIIGVASALIAVLTLEVLIIGKKRYLPLL